MSRASRIAAYGLLPFAAIGYSSPGYYASHCRRGVAVEWQELRTASMGMSSKAKARRRRERKLSDTPGGGM